MKARDFALEMLDTLAAELRSIGSGGRNDALNKAAFKLGRYLQPDVLEEDEVREMLWAAALESGLTSGEIKSTLTSGLNKGRSEPHDLSRFGRAGQPNRAATRRPDSQNRGTPVRPSPNVSKCRPLTRQELEQAIQGLRPIQPGSPAYVDQEGRGLLGNPYLAAWQDALGHLAFEVRGPDGEPWALKVRTNRKEGRYSYLTKNVGAPAWTSPGYGQQTNAFLIEGELNAAAACIGLETYGLPFDVQGMAGASGKPHFEGLKGRGVYVYADGDKAGQDAALKWADMALQAGAASVTLLPPLEALEGEKQDFCDVLGKEGPQALRAALAGLLKAGKPYKHEPALQPPSSPELSGTYESQGGALIWHKPTREGGTVPVKLAKFSAYIVAETIRDDGAEQTNQFALEGQLEGGQPLARVDVPAAQFGSLNWVIGSWGARAIIKPGQAVKDHLRAAIQELSDVRGIASKRVYAFTGWLFTQAGPVYLHAGGAVGTEGPVDGLEVDLSGNLARFCLRPPLTGHDLKEGIRATLEILNVAPLEVSGPLMAGLWRSVLDSCDFALWLVGETGQGKSELAALVQQHFGPELNARNFPGNWSSTPNSLEGLTFAAKDSLTVIDDFAPKGSMQDMARYHSTAERILRAQGNNAGRGRMTAQGTLRPEKAPRGLVLATGEDVPKGHSARARTLILEFPKGGMNWKALTPLQTQARSGVFAGVMAAYLQWLAPQLEAVRGGRHEALERGRELFAGASHARTPAIAADLLWGADTFLTFAEGVGALDGVAAKEAQARLLLALQNAVKGQAHHHEAADPVARFLEILWSLLESGQAHLKDAATGETPLHKPSRYGWQSYSGYEGSAWQQRGEHIGWVSMEGIYLNPEATFGAISKFMSRHGEAVAVTSKTLWKRMDERGLLRRGERDRNTVKVTLGGSRRTVIHLLKGGYAQDDVTTGTTGAENVSDSLEGVPFLESQRDTSENNRDTLKVLPMGVALTTPCPESERDTQEKRDTLNAVSEATRPACPESPAKSEGRGRIQEAATPGQEVKQSW